MREFIKEHDYGFYGFGHYKDRGIDTTENIDTSNSSGSDVEMTPILWKKDKYECVEKGHYWASSNPKEAGSLWKDVPSAHESGRLYPRCVNWLVLKDKDTKEHIMIVSYHADPYTEKVRKLSAQLVMEKVAEVYAKYDDLAVVMAGDWNMERQQPTYSVITGNGYADAQKVAEKTVSQATFNAWKRDVGGFAEADYVFVNHNVYVSQFQVYDNMDPEQLGVYDSDHCPVIADIEY
jgi:endonuclease/exonuclease/phosphatase family metal-dependent hydrolase